MTRILVVEDELALQNAIIEGLKSLGFIVDGVSDGATALDYYYANNYDLILLDINLPYIDGFELLKLFREENLNVKIIVLSARGEVEDKVLGLNLGSNDYISKPFNFMELVARINNLLSRDFLQYSSEICINNYCLDTTKKMLFYQQEIIELTSTEYEILLYLFRNKNIILTSEKIMESIWENDVDCNKASLKVHISHLRNKMPENIIFNKRGVGYYVK